MKGSQNHMKLLEQLLNLPYPRGEDKGAGLP